MACGRTSAVFNPSSGDVIRQVEMASRETVKQAIAAAKTALPAWRNKEAVDGLIESPDVKALSFVGSTPIAEYIHSEGTRRGKRV
nr:aldehyde dehydrogenase family protein [Xenorhabdus hominickii]